MPTSTSGSTAESLERAVKSRVAEEIAKQAAAPKCPGASPHYRIKPVFSGTRSAFLDYNHHLIQAMELASFDPGPGGLSTTESNSTQSRNLRHLILESVTGDAAGMFDNRPDLKGKGFEMVALLRGKFSPRGEDSMYGAFLKLSDMKQLVEETATAYFQRNRSLCTELVECKIPLPPTLLSMFAVRGLSDQFLS